MVVCPKKWTGLGFQHIITIRVYVEIGINKNTFPQSQDLADPFDVWCFETWGIIFAAIGTGKAINLFKGFFMQCGKQLQYLVFVNPLQEGLVGFCMRQRLLFPIDQ